MENFDRASISPFNLFKPTEFSMNHEGNMPDYSQDYNYVNYYGMTFCATFIALRLKINNFFILYKYTF